MRAYNFQDLSGKRFAQILIESYAGKSNNGKTLWNCLCDCGKHFVSTGDNIKSGNTKSCGHLRRERTSEANLKYKVGHRFGSLVIRERIDKDFVLCVCDCGNEVVVKVGNLVSGNTKSCGCFKKELVSQRRTINMTGMRFGELVVIKRISAPGETKNPKWLCLCSCGNYTIVAGCKLRNGHTMSCGHLKNSRSESIIVHYLKALNINYEKEFMFKDLLSEKGNPLRFDFKINYQNNYFLLEYQGEQHYRECKDDFGKQQREVTDLQKKEYCKKNNIELCEIAYNENIIEKLETILINHNLLQDNTVPSSD